MSWFDAYLGAVGNYFSVWFFCLMQIVPFFLALIVGAALLGRGRGRALRHGTESALISFAGFALVFVVMGMPTEPMGKYLFRHAPLFTQLGAVAIALAGLWIGRFLTVREDALGRLLKGALALLFGAGVAFAYKPCVSPALTGIYKIAGQESTSMTGGILLFWYAAGLATVTSLVGVAIGYATESMMSDRGKAFVRRVSAIVILVLAAVIMTDNMTAYKSFLVGRFAPSIEGEAP